MDENRKRVRDYLKESTKTEFYDIIEEAKLTPRQRLYAILRLQDGEFNYRIAQDNNVSTETVRDDLAEVYDRCRKILEREGKI